MFIVEMSHWIIGVGGFMRGFNKWRWLTWQAWAPVGSSHAYQKGLLLGCCLGGSGGSCPCGYKIYSNLYSSNL